MKISMEVGVIAFMRCHKMINGSKLLIFSTGSCDFGHEDFFRTMGPHGTLGPGALGPGLLGPQGLWDPGTLGPWDTGTLGPWDRASWDPRDPGTGPLGTPGTLGASRGSRESISPGAQYVFLDIDIYIYIAISEK